MTSTSALLTLSRRRFALSARTPRELIVPLVTPVMFALVIAPALGNVLGTLHGGIDYMSFVAMATVGLLIPLNTMFAGIGVIADRQGGARRELLTAPIHRPLIVLGNLLVAMLLTGLQVSVLVGVAVVRGAKFHASFSGIAWFSAVALFLTIGMYGVAEILAHRSHSQEEYIGALPAIAIVPWFFAGSLFPISTLPTGLTWFARIFPLTHALAVMRYGLLDSHGAGLHDIWQGTNTDAMAAASVGVVALFAVITMTVALRLFGRSAVR